MVTMSLLSQATPSERQAIGVAWAWARSSERSSLIAAIGVAWARASSSEHASTASTRTTAAGKEILEANMFVLQTIFLVWRNMRKTRDIEAMSRHLRVELNHTPLGARPRPGRYASLAKGVPKNCNGQCCVPRCARSRPHTAQAAALSILAALLWSTAAPRAAAPPPPAGT